MRSRASALLSRRPQLGQPLRHGVRGHARHAPHYFFLKKKKKNNEPSTAVPRRRPRLELSPGRPYHPPNPLPRPSHHPAVPLRRRGPAAAPPYPIGRASSSPGRSTPLTTSMVLGSAWTSPVLYYFVRVLLFARSWHSVAAGFPPVIVFVWFAAAATAIHLDPLIFMPGCRSRHGRRSMGSPPSRCLCSTSSRIAPGAGSRATTHRCELACRHLLTGGVGGAVRAGGHDRVRRCHRP